MTFTPDQRAVELLVRFAPRTDPPTGSVHDDTATSSRSAAGSACCDYSRTTVRPPRLSAHTNHKESS